MRRADGGRIRAVHVCKVKAVAGAETHLLMLLPALAARGIDVRLIVLEDPGHTVDGFCDALSSRGIAVERMRAPRRVDPRLARDLTRRVRALAPDVLHTHLVHADLYGLLVAWRPGIAAISSRHDNNPFRRRPVVRWLNRQAVRRADRVIAISRAVAEFVVTVEGADPSRVAVVPYGLDPQDVAAPPGSDLAGRRAVIGFVGRLEEQKGVDVLLDAVARLRSRHAPARLRIVGDGSLRRRLEDRAARLGLGAAVEFAGWIPNAAATMAHCDVVAVPSRWEGFGLVALEAMAAGKPVVASGVDGLREIVVHGETGLLVPPGNIGALAAALEEVLIDPGRAARFGAAGRRRLLAEFTVGRMVDATLEVYREALASRRPSRTAGVRTADHV